MDALTTGMDGSHTKAYTLLSTRYHLNAPIMTFSLVPLFCLRHRLGENTFSSRTNIHWDHAMRLHDFSKRLPSDRHRRKSINLSPLGVTHLTGSSNSSSFQSLARIENSSESAPTTSIQRQPGWEPFPLSRARQVPGTEGLSSCQKTKTKS